MAVNGGKCESKHKKKLQLILLNAELHRYSRNMEFTSYVIRALKNSLSAVLVNEDRIIEISWK